MVLPAQITVSGMLLTVGCGNTLTVTLSFAEHWPLSVTVTKYFVVADGEATGL